RRLGRSSIWHCGMARDLFRWLCVSLFAACTGLASGPPAFAEPVFPPGLRIGLDPPGDLKLSTRFAGFEDSERQVIIAILDLPASAYRELEVAAFNKVQDELQQVKRESFPFGSGIGFLISGLAQKNDITVYRCSLLATAIGQSIPN